MKNDRQIIENQVSSWPSRDPIEERGGVNLYGFVGNNGINWFDLFGMQNAAPNPPNVPVGSMIRTVAEASIRLTCDEECCKKWKLDADYCVQYEGKIRTVEFEDLYLYIPDPGRVLPPDGLLDRNGPFGLLVLGSEARAKAGAAAKMRKALAGEIDLFGFPLPICIVPDDVEFKINIIVPTTAETFFDPPIIA